MTIMFADDIPMINVGVNLEELEKATTVNIGRLLSVSM
jgi:hypothetical protein